MNRRDVLEMLDLIEKFVGGVDQTKSMAANIEGLLIEHFQDQSWFDDASEALALSVPDSSMPYLDEPALALKLVPVAAALSLHLKASTHKL